MKLDVISDKILSHRMGPLLIELMNRAITLIWLDSLHYKHCTLSWVKVLHLIKDSGHHTIFGTDEPPLET